MLLLEEQEAFSRLRLLADEARGAGLRLGGEAGRQRRRRAAHPGSETTV